MRNGGGGGWSLQGLGRLIRRRTARRGNGEEGRSEGSGDLGRSSPEPGDGGRARETEGSGVAARSPCRWRRASMAGRKISKAMACADICRRCALRVDG